METQHSVDLVKLCHSFTTRRRGEEAYDALLPELHGGTVELNLDGVDVLSASFLDGLLLSLIGGGHLESVLFRSTDPRTTTRLERLSGVRDVDIYSVDLQGRIQKVKRRQPNHFRARFADRKPEPVPD